MGLNDSWMQPLAPTHLHAQFCDSDFSSQLDASSECWSQEQAIFCPYLLNEGELPLPCVWNGLCMNSIGFAVIHLSTYACPKSEDEVLTAFQCSSQLEKLKVCRSWSILRLIVFVIQNMRTAQFSLGLWHGSSCMPLNAFLLRVGRCSRSSSWIMVLPEK